VSKPPPLNDVEFVEMWTLERLPDSMAERRVLLSGLAKVNHTGAVHHVRPEIRRKIEELLGYLDEFEQAQRELPFTTKPEASSK